MMRTVELPDAVPLLSSVYETRIEEPGDAVAGIETFAGEMSAFGVNELQMFGSTAVSAEACAVPAVFVARTGYESGPGTVRSAYVVAVVVVSCEPPRRIA